MDLRLKTVRDFLLSQHVDAVLLTSPLSIGYYTGFSGFSSDEREGYALVTKRKLYLLTSPLYEGAVSHFQHIEPRIYSREHPIGTLVQKIISSENITTLGVEQNNLTLSEYLFFKKLSKIMPLSIRQLRLHKSNEEIKHIQKACAIAAAALETIRPTIRTGMTERDIAKFLMKEIREKDADISFRPIVAFSENSAIPHHVTSDKKLKANDIILIDFGARWNEYCSDMTRTFFHGTPSAEQKQVYDIVLQSQQAAVGYLKASIINRKSNSEIKASKVDQVARDYIMSKGYPSIPHSLGHGIGLEVHEPPFIGPGSSDALSEEMVFSIEPGIYMPGKFGVRIEDLFVIHDLSVIKLTNSAH